MPQIGRYECGVPYVLNPVGGTGVNFTSITPASEVLPNVDMSGTVDDRVVNGTVLNENNTSESFGPLDQGFDSGGEYTSIRFQYDPAMNIDPGATGVPLYFAPGEEGSIVKGVSTDYNSRTSLFDLRAVVHVVATQPPAGAIAPAVCAADKTSRITTSDIDTASLPNITPAFPFPSVTETLQQIRWVKQFHRVNPKGERATSALHEGNFARDTSRVYAEACCLLSLNIDPTIKANIAACIVMHAEEIVQHLELGGRFNVPSTDGGVQNGRKPLVVMAAHLTGDALFTSWAGRTDWAVEDRFVRYVTQEMIDLFPAGGDGIIDGFLQSDLGIPWWFPGDDVLLRRVITDYPIRSIPRRAYQDMWFVNMGPFYGLTGLIPELKTLWNNQPVWDYCDRVFQRTLYDDPTSEVGYGLRTGGTNNISSFGRNLIRNHGPAPVWDWPA